MRPGQGTNRGNIEIMIGIDVNCKDIRKLIL
jgi:hypothetical protein